MSAVMFSGAAQILAAQLIAAGAPVAVTILTCVVVGLRFLMYSAAMAPHLKPLPSRWRHALAFLLTDQAFAAGIRRFRETGDTRNGASYFLGTGVLLWTTWQVSCTAGYWARQRDPDGLVARLHRSALLSRAARAGARGWPHPRRRARGGRSRSWRSTRCPCGCR